MATISPSESTRHLVPKTANASDHLSVASALRPNPRALSRDASPASSIGRTSVVTFETDLLPRQTTQTIRRPGRYNSEAEYLDALRAWVNEKKYFRPGDVTHDAETGLVGFYGQTTLDEYASRPGLGLRKGLREKIGRRRATVEGNAPSTLDDTHRPVLEQQNVTRDDDTVHQSPKVQDEESKKAKRRSSTLGAFLGKRK